VPRVVANDAAAGRHVADAALTRGIIAFSRCPDAGTALRNCRAGAPSLAFLPAMTTLVVVRKHNEVAIAADSLTTFGDTRLSAQFDRIYDKIMRYRDTYVGLCGSAAHQLVFESLLTQHKDLDFGSKAAIFETFRKLHPILKDQHFLNPKEEEDDPYESTQITALIANARGIFGVYSMREVFEYTQFWAVGSGREFALGAMYALYGRLRTATAVAKAGIEAGATFDKNSALPLTLYTLPLQTP
jgi:ATP-dependent HslUV protease subunit HslV